MKKELYQAVKWEVAHCYGDHGCNLVQMWKLVNSEGKQGKFWKDLCLDDYREGVK